MTTFPHRNATVACTLMVACTCVAVQKPQALVPCEAGSKTIDRESGRITFGDGEHGRVPQSTQDYCLARDAQAELADGDPDQPVVTGRVPNSKKKEK